jgi:hypothetical protein
MRLRLERAVLFSGRVDFENGTRRVPVGTQGA